MSESTTHDLRSPTDERINGAVRVVLVGTTGLEISHMNGHGVESVHARSALEAVGEVASSPASARRTVVVVGADAEPNGSLGAFLSAVRSADPGVRIARADAGDEAIRDGYDAVVGPDATPDTIRRLVASERADDRADARSGVGQPIGLGDGSAGRDPGPVAAELKPTIAPMAPPTDSPHADATHPPGVFTGVDTEIAPKPMPTPPPRSAACVGDAAMLGALSRSRCGLLDAALPLMAQRLGVAEIVFVTHGTPDTDTTPVPAVPVVGNGKRYGTIRVGAVAEGDAGMPGLSAREMTPHAEWLASWLALQDRQQTLRRAAFTDPLTGAWNRRYFDAFLDAALARARDARRTVTVLVFDIDGFKQYNDNFGHPAGDEILIETVRALKSSVRPSDRVCRIGGDEFAVIFDEPGGPRVRGSRPPESVYVLAKRVQHKIGEKKFPKLGDDAPGQLTVSGGLAAFPWDGHDAETLLKKADDLACDSKRRGKNAISLGPGAERVCKNAGDDLVE